MDNKNHIESPNIPSLGQRIAWIWLICGLGLLLMGATTSWQDSAFHKPDDTHLSSVTGILQKVSYSAPAKSPTLVELVIYQPKVGMQRGYFRYGFHAWEERLKPYLNQPVTMVVSKDNQVWQVLVKDEVIISEQEIGQRLLTMKQGQQAMADKFILVGFGMILIWLIFLRPKRFFRRGWTTHHSH